MYVRNSAVGIGAWICVVVLSSVVSILEGAIDESNDPVTLRAHGNVFGHSYAHGL